MMNLTIDDANGRETRRKIREFLFDKPPSLFALINAFSTICEEHDIDAYEMLCRAFTVQELMASAMDEEKDD